MNPLFVMLARQFGIQAALPLLGLFSSRPGAGQGAGRARGGNAWKAPSTFDPMRLFNSPVISGPDWKQILPAAPAEKMTQFGGEERKFQAHTLPGPIVPYIGGFR